MGLKSRFNAAINQLGKRINLTAYKRSGECKNNKNDDDFRYKSQRHFLYLRQSLKKSDNNADGHSSTNSRTACNQNGPDCRRHHIYGIGFIHFFLTPIRSSLWLAIHHSHTRPDKKVFAIVQFSNQTVAVNRDRLCRSCSHNAFFICK